MTFVSLLRALRAKWPTLLVGALVGLLVAGLVTVATPRSYSATAGVYVAGIDNGPGADVVAGSLISPQRVASYRELMTSGRVLDVVSQRLGTPVTAGAVTVTSRTDSAVFSVAATSRDPLQAAVVVNAVADRFAELVGELERPGGPGTPPSVSASVVDRAQPATAPTGPRTGSNLLVGLVVGLVVAAAAVLARAATDTAPRSPAALRAVVGGVVLGSLPRVPARHGGPAAPAFDEAARRVRTRLRLAVDLEQPVVLAFTAAATGDGTTTAVCALARTLSRRSRVLVVDADLRRPAVAERLGVSGETGMSDVLMGLLPVDDVVRRSGDVDVLPAGSAPEDPADVLSSPSAAEVLRELRTRYDVVLVDTPALPALDAAVLAQHVDGIVLFAREGQARERIVTAVDALREVGARITGSVLTMTTTASHDAHEGARPVTMSTTARPVVSTSAGVRDDAWSDPMPSGDARRGSRA